MDGGRASPVYHPVGDQGAGFLHLGNRGARTDWLEALFVRENLRSRGIAGEAVRLAEEIVRAQGGKTLYTEVAARNVPAVTLYRHLGYDTLNSVTLRKDFTPREALRDEKLWDLDFKITKPGR